MTARRGFLRLGLCGLALTPLQSAASQSSSERARGALPPGLAGAREQLEHSLARLERFEWTRAFDHVDARGARLAADALDRRWRDSSSMDAARPLFGMPLAIKDNIHVAGLPTRAGTPGLDAYRARDDAPVVAALRGAGAIALGKAKMHELAFGGTTSSGFAGAVQNPWRRGFIPGGSSGGTAAAIAAGVVRAGLGTDTLGSVRMPASLCGIAALRPSTGRYSSRGIVPLAPSSDTAGPMAATVKEVARLDAALRGVPFRLPERPLTGARLGWLRSSFQDKAETGVQEAVAALIEQAARQGATVVELSGDALRMQSDEIGVGFMLEEMIPALRLYLSEYVPGTTLESLVASIFTDDIRQTFEQQMQSTGLGRSSTDPVPSPDGRLAGRRRLRDEIEALVRTHRLDGILYPCTPITARPIRARDTIDWSGEERPASMVYPRNTIVASQADLPAVTVCAGLTPQGLPVGLELLGPRGAEESLLALAANLEGARGPLPWPD